VARVWPTEYRPTTGFAGTTTPGNSGTDGTFPNSGDQSGNLELLHCVHPPRRGRERVQLLLTFHSWVASHGLSLWTLRIMLRSGERPASHSRPRCRPQHLLGIATPVFGTARGFSAGVLPDVQSCAPDRGAAPCRGTGASAQASSWALRGLLECASVFQRARVARTLLFVPAR